MPFQLFVPTFSLHSITSLATRQAAHIRPLDPSIFLGTVRLSNRLPRGGLRRAPFPSIPLGLVSLPFEGLRAVSLSNRSNHASEPQGRRQSSREPALRGPQGREPVESVEPLIKLEWD